MGFVSQAVGNIVGGLTGGIMNSSGARNTFAGTTPDIEKQDLIGQINALTPQQQQLTQMLMAQSQGQGPNPAQQMLNQATNRNVQQGAGMIASQKGISPALAARLIAQNTANANQTAAGQGALMGAQQQLNAEGLLNNNLTSQQQILQNAQSAQNQAINTGELGAQGLTAQAAGQNATTAGQITGGIFQGIGGAAMAGAGKYKGGEITGYATGGDITSNPNDWRHLTGLDNESSFSATGMGKGMGMLLAAGAKQGAAAYNNPLRGSSTIGNTGASDLMTAPIFNEIGQTAWTGGKIKGYDEGGDVDNSAAAIWHRLTTSAATDNPNAPDVSKSYNSQSSYAKGGKIPIIVSPGELLVHPNGKKEKVGGKAPVKGDSPKNDIVPRAVEGGTVVVPRTKANNEDKTARFMEELKKKKEGESEPQGFSRVLKARKHLQTAHSALLEAHKAMKGVA